MCKLTRHRRVERHVGELRIRIDVRRQTCQVVLECDLLVFGFDDDLRRLEQHVAGPLRGVTCATLGNQRLQLAEDAVVLGLEDAVHCRQRVVFVVPPIARDEVLGQQFVVVEARRLGSADRGVCIGQQSWAGRGTVGDVIEQLVAGANNLSADHFDFGHAAGIAVQRAVGVELQLRQVEHILIDQCDADARRIDLDVGPIRQAAVQLRARCLEMLQHAPGGHAAGVVFLQQSRHHGIRAVADAHVRPRGDDVVVDALARRAVNLEVGPRQDHEVGRPAVDVQRVARQQRQVDQAIRSFGHQVQVVREELAEDRVQLAGGQTVQWMG